MMTDSLTRFLRILISLLVPLILILGIIRLIPTETYLSIEYGKTNFPTDPFGFDPTMRFSHAIANLNYVREDQPIDALAEQKHEGAPLYNSRELKHMQDVENVYLAMGRIWHSAILFLLVALLVFWMRQDSLSSVFSAIKIGGLLTAGLIAAIGLLAVLAWQSWFVVFHEVFFAAGSWTFNAADTLIRLFPEQFWFDTALNVSLASLAAGLILFLSSSGMEWFLQRNHAEF